MIATLLGGGHLSTGNFVSGPAQVSRMALVAIASDVSLQSEASDDNLAGSSTGDVTMAQPLLAQVSYALTNASVSSDSIVSLLTRLTSPYSHPCLSRLV